ncbi:hypothetical protein M2347_003977 [Chryseobacterium sp. H1D6B]|uniref:DcaP family trimeric outer membrane transporter n=1 Tax=Chryseobacterium sp. H1D6B TaxID=2940588 RepID=UPI0015CE42D2|nr:DcaP family trimeric outer membrane transporter [Chryseobacterium sp. H1D6B]MDH6254250.1 hypothetical protein [Chryseobacterium sp. H1D6B]
MTKKTHQRLLASFILVSLLNGKMYSQTTIKTITTHQSAASASSDHNAWSVYLKGFIQTDVMLDFQETASKDGFAVPSILIPQHNSISSNFSVKQSQIGLGVKQSDSDISAYVEIDFLGPNGTTAPRFRKGYVQWKKLLAGQTWSNFSDAEIFPNIFDFAGPNGTLFLRTIQIRYTTQLSKKEILSLSLEDANARSISLPANLAWKKKAMIPSFTALYRYGNERNYFKLGSVLSPISYEMKNAEEKYTTHTVLGFGGMISARLFSSNLHNFRFQSSYGKGYANNNIVLSHEGYDAVPDLQNNKLKTLNLLNIVGIYEHWWTPKWSSVVYYSYSETAKESFIPENMIQDFQNTGINLVFQPYRNLRLGAEGNYGKSKNFAQKKAEAFRIQFSTAFSF